MEISGDDICNIKVKEILQKIEESSTTETAKWLKQKQGTQFGYTSETLASDASYISSVKNVQGKYRELNKSKSHFPERVTDYLESEYVYPVKTTRVVTSKPLVPACTSTCTMKTANLVLQENMNHLNTELKIKDGPPLSKTKVHLNEHNSS